MSNYEWEKGEFHLSLIGMRKFIDAFYTAYNASAAKDKLTLEALRQDMIASTKGQRAKDWGQIFHDTLRKSITHGYPAHCSTLKYEFSTIDIDHAYSILLVTVDPATKAITRHPPRSVRKSDFPIANVRNKPVITFDDATICIDPSTRTLSWYVSENNHACDRAHKHPLGDLFWRALATVEWTRGTGGVLVGNNEYNRDDYSDGGGANYVKTRLGPIGAQHDDSFARPRLPTLPTRKAKLR